MKLVCRKISSIKLGLHRSWRFINKVFYWSYSVKEKLSHYIFTIRVLLNLTYLDKLTPMKSHHALITWSYNITSQTKIVCFHYHSVYDHQIWQDGMMDLCQLSHATLWSSGFVRLRDKLKPLYLHYRSAYGHQTWQDSNLPKKTPACKITSPFDHVVLRDHVTN